MQQVLSESLPMERPSASRFFIGLGRIIARLSGDPVLASFIEVVGARLPLSSLGVVLQWRVMMSVGSYLARFRFLRRRFLLRTQYFHRLNKRFDQVALSIARTPLVTDIDRSNWCRIFGIHPERDLAAPLQSFACVNDLFTHAPGPGTRPQAEPDNENVVTAPCDGSYAIFTDTARLRSFVSKQSHFELGEVLGTQAAHFQEGFTSGAAAFIWLSAVDNHCWYAPLSGTVVHAERIEARTHGRMGLFLEDGYCEANTRGVIILERDDGRRIALIAIGLTPINSISIGCWVGQRVRKGDFLGRFEVGGSAALLLFDRRLTLRFKSDFGLFSQAEDLLNLNYVADRNKARSQIGEALAVLDADQTTI